MCMGVCYLEIADVGYHVREERVACNVEWNTQSLCVCVCVCGRHLDTLVRRLLPQLPDGMLTMSAERW